MLNLVKKASNVPKIKTAQIKAAVGVNVQLIELYWQLASDIVQKQKQANWGDAVLEQLSVFTIEFSEY